MLSERWYGAQLREPKVDIECSIVSVCNPNVEPNCWSTVQFSVIVLYSSPKVVLDTTRREERRWLTPHLWCSYEAGSDGLLLRSLAWCCC